MSEEKNEPAPAEGVTETPAEAEKEMSKEEKELEQKMIKVITKMPESVQPRFKALHMYSDERSKINDLFEAEVKKLTARIEEKKRPILERRDNILRGELKN